jgi:hypothetical protein
MRYAIACCFLFAVGCGDSFDELRGGTAAIKAIHQLHAFQVLYRQNHGRYAETLETLGVDRLVVATDGHSRWRHWVLSEPPATEYLLTMRVVGNSYTIHADPVGPQENAIQRAFFSDESLVIRNSFDGRPATVNSREIGMQ